MCLSYSEVRPHSRSKVGRVRLSGASCSVRRSSKIQVRMGGILSIRDLHDNSAVPIIRRKPAHFLVRFSAELPIVPVCQKTANQAALAYLISRQALFLPQVGQLAQTREPKTG